MTSAEARVRALLAEGALDLPPPAEGATVERLRSTAAARGDRGPLGGPADRGTCRRGRHLRRGRSPAPSRPDGAPAALAGVWASRFGGQDLRAERTSSGWHVSGRLAFCSGAGIVDIALVDAELDDGRRQLFAIP